jgi:uncharacterized protein with NAD-binding domain and iron-sulfur cluster
MSDAVKKKAVVLGAGPAGLAAAMGLIETGQYEVDVYSMGWRAGGKCATGREPDSGRTWQNGSHYLFGCYHNAFALVRRAHAVLAEHQVKGFGTFGEDFVSRNLLVGAEGYQRLGAVDTLKLDRWFRYLPQNMASPGEDGKYPSPFDYVLMVFQFVTGLLIDLFLAVVSDEDGPERFDGVRFFLRILPISPFEHSTRSRVTRAVLSPFRWAFNLVTRAMLWFWSGVFTVLATFILPPVVLNWPRSFWERVRDRLVTWLGAFAQTARDRVDHWNPNASKALQRLIILFEIGVAVMIGFYEDRLYEPGGFAKIDDIDFRDWLRKHGATEIAVWSSLITTWYDATIAYRDGQQGSPACSAGVALNAMLRSLLTYKGAFAYQMTAEVGDSFVGPVVKALELMGVRFHFYHRVAQIQVDPALHTVEKITLGVQVENPPSTAAFIDFEYGPPQHRKQRQSWPHVAGHSAAAAAAVPPLDSYYSPMPTTQRVLERRHNDESNAGDAGFDVVVCALPLGIVQDVLRNADGSSVASTASSWQATFENVHFSESQAVRMWFNATLAQLGWTEDPPILSGNDWPHSTWEDNSQAISIQSFPPGPSSTLHSIATVFGPLETVSGSNVRSIEHANLQLELAKAHAQTFLNKTLLNLWPGMRSAHSADHLDWNLFIDLGNGQGEQRFAWQHVVANVGPSESYVVTIPGTLRYRPRADESGYKNLYLAGDWTRNGVEAGTVEGAIISGLKASRAVSGLGAPIIGGDDFDRGTALG